MPDSLNKSYYEKIRPEIHQRVEAFVSDYFPDEFHKVRDEKIIHDALHGTQLFTRAEISLLDSPLIQRLRQIRQTAFTYFTYPSATHSRFEHTIGVAYLVDKFVREIRKTKYSVDSDSIRIAALLHDCGHGPFSHTSEEVYRFYDDMYDLTKPGSVFEGVKPHEVLSVLIVMSKKFKKVMDEIAEYYKLKYNYRKVIDAIIGKAGKKTLYFTEILNGPFDADKLDYIYRDGYFTGLPLLVDYDRIWYATKIKSVEGWDRLTVAFNGVTPIEELLFSKMVLFSTIYHHHKVRACDCMLKGIFEYIKKNRIKIEGRTLKYSTDFLWLTDDKIFGLVNQKSNKDEDLHELIHNLLYRRLLKRALVISESTVEKSEGDNLSKLLSLSDPTKEAQQKLRDLAKEIWEKSNKPCLQEEIWVDLPTLPHIGEAEKIYACQGGDSFVKIRELFPVDKWIKQYGLYKRRGHVFCPAKCVTKVSKIAKKVIEDRYNLKFKDYAFKFCHINDTDL